MNANLCPATNKLQQPIVTLKCSTLIFQVKLIFLVTCFTSFGSLLTFAIFLIFIDMWTQHSANYRCKMLCKLKMQDTLQIIDARYSAN